MLASGLYDGWILGNSDRLNELIAQEGVVSAMEKRIVLLQGNPFRPVPPVCLKVFSENIPQWSRKLVELVQKASSAVNEEYLIPYIGVCSKRKHAGKEK